MKQKIEQWVIDWLTRRVSGREVHVDLSVNFYQSGLLDSFGIIELIDAVEAEFDFCFDDADFLLPSFRTVGGFASIVDEKVVSDSERETIP